MGRTSLKDRLGAATPRRFALQSETVSPRCPGAPSFEKAGLAYHPKAVSQDSPYTGCLTGGDDHGSQFNLDQAIAAAQRGDSVLMFGKSSDNRVPSGDAYLVAASAPVALFLVLKNFLDPHAEGVRDPERQFERRRILAPLDRDDRLPRRPDPLGERLLRQFAMFKPKTANGIANHHPAHACTLVR